MNWPWINHDYQQLITAIKGDIVNKYEIVSQALIMAFTDQIIP